MRVSSAASMILVVTLVACGLGKAVERARLEKIAARYERGETDQAIRELRAFLAEYQDNDQAWTILGNAYESLDRGSEALAAYERALALRPDSWRAITARGVLHRKAGDYDEAMACYARAIEINPDHAQAYSSMAVIEMRRGDDAQALRHAERAFQLDDEDPVIAANLAIAYHHSGQIRRRDELTQNAARLGYRNTETLRRIFGGQLTIRD